MPHALSTFNPNSLRERQSQVQELCREFEALEIDNKAIRDSLSALKRLASPSPDTKDLTDLAVLLPLERMTASDPEIQSPSNLSQNKVLKPILNGIYEIYLDCIRPFINLDEVINKILPALIRELKLDLPDENEILRHGLLHYIDGSESPLDDLVPLCRWLDEMISFESQREEINKEAESLEADENAQEKFWQGIKNKYQIKKTEEAYESTKNFQKLAIQMISYLPDNPVQTIRDLLLSEALVYRSQLRKSGFINSGCDYNSLPSFRTLRSFNPTGHVIDFKSSRHSCDIQVRAGLSELRSASGLAERVKIALVLAVVYLACKVNVLMGFKHKPSSDALLEVHKIKSMTGSERVEHLQDRNSSFHVFLDQHPLLKIKLSKSYENESENNSTHSIVDQLKVLVANRDVVGLRKISREMENISKLHYVKNGVANTVVPLQSLVDYEYVFSHLI